MKTETDKLLEKQQLLNSQIKVFSGQISNENILEDYSSLLKELEQIYFTDILTKTTIDLLIAPIKQAGFEIIARDRTTTQLKAKRFLEFTINSLIDGFSNVLNHSLFSVVTGSQFFEIVWNVEKFEDILCNRIIRLVPIKNENIVNYLYNSKGDFVGLEIYDDKKDIITLNKEDIFYVIHHQFFNDVRGNSEIRAILPLVKTKQALIKYAEKTIARGVGVPIAYATENYDESKNELYKKLLRNIAATDGAYALVSKTDIEKIEFLTVNQSNIMPLLEFLNRDIFFNTLTQFLTTGLGQNGARATAEELKSPYLLKVGSILAEIESYFQWLCNIIIENSSLKLVLNKEDYPIFKFVNVTEIDMQNFANTISTLANVGLKLNDDDLSYIRKLLQLPEKTENVETEGNLNRKDNKINLRQRKINDFEVFEYETLKNLFDKTEKDLQVYFDNLIKKIAIDIFIAKKTNSNFNTTEIYNKLYNDIAEKIKKVKEESSNIALKELKKLNYKLTHRYKFNNEIDTPILEFIIKIIDSLQLDLFDSAESYEYIEKQIKNNIKQEERQLITSVQNEITNIRNEIFVSEGVRKFRYTTSLDENVCDVCSPLHNIIINKEEIEDLGLSLTAPVNPNCSGLLRKGGHCRCQLIPV